MHKLIEKAFYTHTLTKAEIAVLLSDNSLDEELFLTADAVRKKYSGDEVHLRALIEFSNICMQKCLYCGIRSENKKIQRYRMSAHEIINTAKYALKCGYRTIVLQGGEDDFFDAERLSFIISEIKKLDTAITLSIGERSFEDYKAFKDAGADRFLLRIETTDRKLYEKMHPNMDFDNRVRCLYDIKSLGYETGTGCLVGLPGQNIESLADDILFFKELNADMIGVGPFIPHPDTPLNAGRGGAFNLALKVMAVTRLLLPDINIPATTAMETLRDNGRIIALKSGANVVMPNVTDITYRKKYEIYPNKVSVDYNEIEKQLTLIGRHVSKKYGFRGGKK